MFKKALVLILVSTSFYSGSISAASSAHHVPGIFIGYTITDDETEFTYGLEYEYKFNQSFGIGAVYEKSSKLHHGDGVSVLLVSGYYHPTKNIRLGLGVGEEEIGGDHPHTEDLYRISTSYDFHVGKFGIAPTLAVDFIDDKKAYVLGVALVRPF